MFFKPCRDGLRVVVDVGDGREVVVVVRPNLNKAGAVRNVRLCVGVGAPPEMAISHEDRGPTPMAPGVADRLGKRAIRKLTGRKPAGGKP